ncbi:MAG: ComF family protein [Ilumatobacteraceae bacterium]|nr:ComF family protein [Acidimicrobiia bacterium]
MEREPHETFRPILSALAYDGDVRRRVVDMKYGGRRSFARELARQLADAVRSDTDMRIDVVTWAPTSSSRRRHRGFDQAAVIARHVARELGVPCRRLLVRETRVAQTGRSRVARLAGPRFRALDTRRPRRVLVVDDVVTTGATLRAAAHALTASGWGDVTLAAVASTPTSRVGSSHRRPNVVIRPRDADRGTQRPTRDRTRSMAGL